MSDKLYENRKFLGGTKAVKLLEMNDGQQDHPVQKSIKIWENHLVKIISSKFGLNIGRVYDVLTQDLDMKMVSKIPTPEQNESGGFNKQECVWISWNALYW